MSQDLPSKTDEALTKYPDQDLTPKSTQGQFPVQITPQEYLSPYASNNVDVARPSSILAQPIEFPKNTSTPVIADKVNEIIARAKANGGKEVKRGSLEWEAARESVLADMQSVGPGILPSWVNVTDVSRVEARTGGRRGRGPRRRGSPVAMGTIKLDAIPDRLAESPSNGRGRARGRGGRLRGSRGSRGGRGGKRKRSGNEDDEGGENDDTDSSETFTPLPTQSRSGRKIFQANTSTPIIKIDDKAVLEASLPSINRSSVTSSSKKRKGSYRRSPGANALCKNCGRGHSPSSNVIVFCDGCNTPWHQYCHNPPIKGEIVQIEEKEWFCADCMVTREEQGRFEGRVAGDGLSFSERRQYLQTLPQEDLISLLLHACTLHPSLPIFEPDAAQTVQAANVANAVIPAPSSTDPLKAELAEVEEYYEEEDVLPYPKAGNGITLRPESEDLAFLLDDDTVTFSHSWTDDSTITPESQGFLGMSAGALSVCA
ncbi:hypothetical protein MMC13_002428 [Lambiella insularis]|nr:hypothetical protein [Lambiella insularis]